jgi:hypothetical protein
LIAAKNAEIQQSLVLAIARAYRQKELLEKGKYVSVFELSDVFGLSYS